MKQIFTTVLVCISAAVGQRKRFGKQDKKAQQQRLAALFNQLVSQHELAIDHSEIINGLLIALDRKNKKLLAIEEGKINEQHCISLTTVSTVLVVRDTGNNGIIQKIFLVLKQKGSDKAIRLCFFDEAYNRMEELLRLTRCALAWKSRVELYKQTGFA